MNTPNINRNNLTETPSSYQNSWISQQSLFSSQTGFNNHDLDYQKLKLITLQLWQNQLQKLGNFRLPSLPIKPPCYPHSSPSATSRMHPKLVIMAALLIVRVGSFSLSLTSSSSGLWPIPSIFCASIGISIKLPLLILSLSNPLVATLIAIWQTPLFSLLVFHPSWSLGC